MEVECDNCGEITDKKPCRVERSEHDFCSRECSDEYQRHQFSGESNPNYQGGGEYECLACGERVETTPSKAEKGVYCSQECMAVDFQDRYSGEDNPSWNGGMEEVECEWCGDVEEFVPAEAGVRRFCSDECYKEWLSEEMSGKRWMGEENPAYKDGRARDRYYGPNWSDQRKVVLDRDGECILCGTTDKMEVHHKTPLREFDRDEPYWWKRANALDNLVTLCKSCHKTVHHNVEEHFGDLMG